MLREPSVLHTSTESPFQVTRSSRHPNVNTQARYETPLQIASSVLLHWRYPAQEQQILEITIVDMRPLSQRAPEILVWIWTLVEPRL